MRGPVYISVSFEKRIIARTFLFYVRTFTAGIYAARPFPPNSSSLIAKRKFHPVVFKKLFIPQDLFGWAVRSYRSP